MTLVFDPDRLHAIARLGAGRPHAEMCEVVTAELRRAYGRHVAARPRWVFNLAAGATGMMTVLHGSLTEYVLIYGSATGTEGFSGRYFLDVYDWVMTGEMSTYTERAFAERVVTRPGEGALLRRGEAKGWRIREGTWMLEYGRGLIPTALAVGLADAAVSAVDPLTVGRTLRAYGGEVLRSLARGKV